MANLVYHKQIKKRFNVEKEKYRYAKKRTDRMLKAMLPPPEDLMAKANEQITEVIHQDYPDLVMEFSESGDTVTITGPENKEFVKEKKQSLFDRFLSKLTKK